jgi:drug/metabolite transporter (DMT)-like permease
MELKPTVARPADTGIRRRYSLISKTAVVSAVVVATNVIANYALSRGLRQIGIVESWSPIPYIEAFSRPWVAVGVIFMAAWLITRLSLLSWADLTYVLPVTSFSYVLTAIVGVVWAHERVSNLSWAGICLITVGILLVLLTYPKTTNGSGNS